MTMGISLELRHLKLLAAIVEAGSVTGAALRLHLTQSALSHQLREAEEKIGTALFLRIKKKMLLTPAGEELLGSARRVLSELERTEERLRGFGETAGTIRLSTECYTCYHWLPPVLKAFRRRFPGVDVRIDLEATRRTVAALLEGKLDLGIISSEPDARSLQLHPILEDEMVVVMPEAHRLAQRGHLRPRDLAQETLLIYPPREDSLLLRLLARAGVLPKAVLEVPLTEAIVEMARAGIGVGFLAQWAVPPRQSAGLAKRPLTRLGIHRLWKAATLRGQKLNPSLEGFLRLLAEVGRPLSVTRARAAARRRELGGGLAGP
jgi:LysR family transcriptional regulator, regulator for metE and metH